MRSKSNNERKLREVI